ncbi:MAG: hypothetical protein J1F35_03645 [Erysipelotrichales bacterium]|nr:hypothetical protein [Erysipelotrichales bacterium]
MANNLFYTYKHPSGPNEENFHLYNDGTIPQSILGSYYNSLIFDVGRRTIWHEGWPFGHSYWGSSYGEIFNDFVNNEAGKYSHAEGYNTKAIGNYSHSEGYGTSTYGWTENENEISYLTGDFSHTEGCFSYALGTYSHAEGSRTYAIGFTTHAEGVNTKAFGDGSHSEGNKTMSYGNCSHAEGNATVSRGWASHTEGLFTQALGQTSHAEGESTIAYGEYSHSEGSGTYAQGTYSHSEGYNTYAIGQGSHAEGFCTYARGLYTHAEGFNTYSEGLYSSHAEGYNTYAIGNSAHSEGRNTYAIGNYSHAEGYNTEARGTYSHSGGNKSKALTSNSFVHGLDLLTTNPNEIAFGEFNQSYTKGTNISYTLFSIGNGVENKRSNVFEIQNTGISYSGNKQLIDNIRTFEPGSENVHIWVGNDSEWQEIVELEVVDPENNITEIKGLKEQYRKKYQNTLFFIEDYDDQKSITDNVNTINELKIKVKELEEMLKRVVLKSNEAPQGSDYTYLWTGNYNEYENLGPRQKDTIYFVQNDTP